MVHVSCICSVPVWAKCQMLPCASFIMLVTGCVVETYVVSEFYFNWTDRQTEMPIAIACSNTVSNTLKRMEFE